MIKAIETYYNGYRFRSRLEARWAVFFDKLGIKYEYEKEGFDLDGVWYLPDFWLPDLKCWVEIKGEKPTEQETSRLIALTKGTGKSGYLIWGSIPAKEWEAYDRMWEWYKDGEFRDCGMVWTACCYCPCVGLAFSGYGRGLPCSCNSNKESDIDRIDAAYSAARSARFEHRERGIA